MASSHPHSQSDAVAVAVAAALTPPPLSLSLAARDGSSDKSDVALARASPRSPVSPRSKAPSDSDSQHLLLHQQQSHHQHHHQQQHPAVTAVAAAAAAAEPQQLPVSVSTTAADAPLPPAPQVLPTPKSSSFRSHRHRKTYSIDSVPRQTIMKALVSRPPPTSNMSIASSLNGILASSAAADGHRASFSSASASSSANDLPARRLSEALNNLRLDQGCLTATKVAALASPCFFHKKFDGAVNIEKVLDEIRDDDMSHSRLMQTATGVREVSKQLQRRPIKMTFRNIMIITKARDNELVVLTRELAEWLLCTPRNGSDVGVNVYVDAKLRKSKRFDAPGLLRKNDKFHSMLRYWTPDLCWTSPEKFDLVVTLGGDGTVLFTSWLFQRIVPPVLSFSLGSLGFLTNFEYQSFKESLDRTMGESGMRVNLRMRFTCTVYRACPDSPGAAATDNTADEQPTHIEGEQFEVLNELVIDRGPSPYVSQLELYGDNSLITVIQADGCIFSTPTGSTAYSLSAGGSLVHPDIPAILLTPICPHTLSFRPMLLNDTMLLRIAVPRNSRATAYCAFDGKGRVELRQGDHVTIAASQYPFPTVLSRPTEWFDSISRTLRWNTRGAQQKAWDSTPMDPKLATKEPEFDIDFDDDADRDSGYSAEGSSVGGTQTPMRRPTLTM